MASDRDGRLARLVEQIQGAPGIAEGLPAQEGEMVRAAVRGESVHAIAQRFQVSEEAVWRQLGQAARAAAGQGAAQVETGGLGSDTDPGVTGGYGDTGFGSIGNDPPLPVTDEEPDEE